MKQLLTTLILIASLAISATAQEPTKQETGSTIYLDQSGTDSLSSKDGHTTLTIAGMRFDFGNHNPKSTTTQKDNSIKIRIPKFNFMNMGDDSKYNHLALHELGSNFIVNTDYSMYTPEEANALAFGNHKSVYCAINLMSMNMQFNPKRTLGFTLGFGFAMENYSFAGDYSMEFRDGLMRPIALDPSTKKSKLLASYIHIPLLLDWNISKGFFISAGVNLDILMNSELKYKKPKTTLEGKAMLNPFQVGVTARIGWRKLYGFVNYSLMDMYKADRGPGAHRMSAGVGLWF